MEAPADIDLLCEEELEDEPRQIEEAAASVDRQLEEDAAIIHQLVLDQRQIASIKGVDSQTRASIIDSMLGSLNARLYPRAIYLAVQIFDHCFVAAMPMQPNHDNVASLALYIAVKFEYGITKAQRITFAYRSADAEYSILRGLDFRLHRPPTNLFVEVLLRGNADRTLGLLCSYVTELSLLDVDCSVLLPSFLAVACVFLAKFVLDPWTRPQVESPYHYKGSLRKPVQLLRDLYTGRRFPALRSTRDKYRFSQEIPEEYFD